MIKQLRTYVLLMLTFSLVGVQTACACNHEFGLQQQADASDHCHEMAMTDGGHDMPAPVLEDDCDHVPANEFMAVRSDVDDSIVQPALDLILPVQYAAVEISIPDMLGSLEGLRPIPPPDLPFARKTVFLN